MDAIAVRVAAQPERARVAIASEGANLEAAILASERLFSKRDPRPGAEDDRFGNSAFVDDVDRLPEQLPHNPYP
jgi:hypothetical protein